MAQARRTEVAVPEGMVLRQRAYRFRLDPTPRQEGALLRYAGARRYAYNWAVSYFRAVDAQRRTEREAAGEPRTRQPSFIDLSNAFNAWKQGRTTTNIGEPALPKRWAEDARNPTVAPAWLTTRVPAHLLKWALREARDGLAGHISSLQKGEWVTRWKRDADGARCRRRCPRIEFPDYKARRSDRTRFKLDGPHAAGGTGGPIDCTHIAIPVPRGCVDPDLLALRRVHTRESMRRLWKAMSAVDRPVLIKNTTISCDRQGRWWVAFCTEQRVSQAQPTPRMLRNGAVGVDLGVRQLAALSTGHSIRPVTALADVELKTRTVDRAISRAKRGSSNQRKLLRRRARLLGRAAGLRRDATHKATTALARSFAVVAIEDLNVIGMTSSARGSAGSPGSQRRQKAGLNRAVRRSSFAEFRRQLEYKAHWHGTRLHVVDRFAPTSKTCSVCGERHPSLALADRVFDCGSCGASVDRDLNAAVNICRLATGRPVPAQGGHPVSLRRPPATWRAPTPQTPIGEPGTTNSVPRGSWVGPGVRNRKAPVSTTAQQTPRRRTVDSIGDTQAWTSVVVGVRPPSGRLQLPGYGHSHPLDHALQSDREVGI